MTLGRRIRQRREELGLSRADLAKLLGVTTSAVGNYESDVSFPKERVFLRLFDCLDTEPNALLQDSFRGSAAKPSATKPSAPVPSPAVPSDTEQAMLKQYRSLSALERETVRNIVDALCACREERELEFPAAEPRQIPLYRSPAAAGYTAPVFGEDFDYIPVAADVPLSAEYAVRIQGDSMSPWIADGCTAYVNRDPLRPGDVGIFCVDGEMYCKQYYRDPAGIVYLFSLNRRRADADLVLTPSGGRTLICLGRVILRAPPLPGMEDKG